MSEKIEIFYLFGQKIIGVRESTEHNNCIKDAFEVIPLPARGQDGGMMFVPIMNEVPNIKIENMSMIPIRPPTDEEKQIYDMNMREKSPITTNIDPIMVEKLKKISGIVT